MQTRFINSFSKLLEIQNNYGTDIQLYNQTAKEIQTKADKFISF